MKNLVSSSNLFCLSAFVGPKFTSNVHGQFCSSNSVNIFTYLLFNLTSLNNVRTKLEIIMNNVSFDFKFSNPPQCHLNLLVHTFQMENYTLCTGLPYLGRVPCEPSWNQFVTHLDVEHHISSDPTLT